jgi:hypothetical protein
MTQKMIDKLAGLYDSYLRHLEAENNLNALRRLPPPMNSSLMPWSTKTMRP